MSSVIMAGVAVTLMSIGLIYLPLFICDIYRRFKCKLGLHVAYEGLDWCKRCGENVNDE